MTDVIAGRFALCDPIARGGSGVVWRAFDRKVGRYCAAKVLRRRDAGDLLRFVREQSVRVSHPNVLTPYSWAAEDAHVAIASELVDGGSLSTLISENGALAEATAAAVLGQLLAALEHVHDAGMVHRDVKPANLLLHASGTGPIHVRLTDFGLAVTGRDARLTVEGTVVGTPGYLPPELLAGPVEPHPCHDLYAAGQVAAAMLTGVEPAQRLPAQLDAIRPSPLRDLVADLTALDPNARPQTAGQAMDRLRSFLADPHPRTIEGELITVRHQLPPLPPDAGQGSDVAAAPMAVALTAPVPVGQTQVAPLQRPRSRRVLVAVIAAAAAAAIGIPVALALTGGEAPGPNPPSTSGSTPVVQAGDACDFTEEGNLEDGDTLVCRRTGTGEYLWVSASPASP